MICRAVHSILCHLRPRHDLHILESLAQCSDLCILLVRIEHERIWT